MSILTQKLPQVVIIEGLEVRIKTDFRTSIQFEQILKNKSLSDEEIWNQALNLYYPIIPENINEAINQMLWFYRCGKELKQNESEEKQHQEVYSFEHDADSIYNAFRSQYNVNLKEEEDLHWWEFKAMFNGFKEDTDIAKKMSIRAMDTNKLPLEQREYYKKLKKLYEIPRDEEEEEIDELDLVLMNGGDLEGIL